MTPTILLDLQVVKALSQELTSPSLGSAASAPGTSPDARDMLAKSRSRLRQLTLQALHAYSGHGGPGQGANGSTAAGALVEAKTGRTKGYDNQLLEMACQRLMECCSIRRPGKAHTQQPSA